MLFISWIKWTIIIFEIDIIKLQNKNWNISISYQIGVLKWMKYKIISCDCIAIYDNKLHLIYDRPYQNYQTSMAGKDTG